MAIQQAIIKIQGVSPLLQNNPQTVDPFNRFAKAKKVITNKKAKTDDDLIELGNLEVESKVFFDDELGVYVPATWLTESVVTKAFAIAKISKDKMRGGLFATESKLKLQYRDMGKVQAIQDIVANPVFRHNMILPQQNVRIAKNFPIFHKWSFETILEFDDYVVDFGSLKNIIQTVAKYGGYGDFRPTFGRAFAEVENV
jgi:hypothetical protein